MPPTERVRGGEGRATSRVGEGEGDVEDRVAPVMGGEGWRGQAMRRLHPLLSLLRCGCAGEMTRQGAATPPL